MRSIVRGLAALLTLVAVYFFAFWMSSALLFAFGIPARVFLVGALFVAIGAAVYVWRATASASGGLGSYILSGALLIGAIGFSGGFFGPIIFAPGANQGPLLGIFITGPVGFILGAISGGVYWHLRSRAATPSLPRATSDYDGEQRR